LSEKSPENQENTIFYTIGDVTDDILSSFGLSDDDKKKYDIVAEKFEGHFVKKRNMIFEHAKFNQGKREEAESTDEFIIDLYYLSKSCNYGRLREEMIRDRIVMGIRGAKLSEKL